MNWITRFVLVSACFSVLVLTAQDDEHTPGLELGVKITHKGKPYTKAKVFVSKNGSPFDIVSLMGVADLDYLLEYGHRYFLEFKGEGLASKTIEVDLLAVPEYETKTHHIWELGVIDLFKAYEGLNLAALADPVARIHYSEDELNFAIDYKYSSSRRFELEKLDLAVENFEEQEEAENKQKQKDFEEVMKEASKLEKMKSYERALEQYTAAAVILPEDEEARQKIQELNRILSEEKEYKAIIAGADELFEKGEWIEARDKYLLASGLKPDAAYPKGQISKIAQKVQDEEAKANTFNNYLMLAEEAYSNGNYASAVENYTKALGVNPEAALAKKKLQMAKSKKEEKDVAEKQEQEFTNYLNQAQSARQRGDLEQASLYLTMAAEKKATDPRLLEEKNILNDLKEKKKESELAAQKEAADQARFEELMEQSKEATDRGNYSLAIELLDEAALVKPENQQIAEERRHVNELVADQKQRELLEQQEAERVRQKEAQFNLYMAKGKASENIRDLKSAAKYYQKCLELDPSSMIAKGKLQGVQIAMREEVQARAEANKDLEKMDKKSEAFLAELAARYPQGVTEEKYKDGNKSITKRIVVEGNRGTEYMKVEHDWGGVFYFKNGDAISQNKFESETSN